MSFIKKHSVKRGIFSHWHFIILLFFAIVFFNYNAKVFGQSGGSIKGSVVLQPSNAPAKGVSISIRRLNLETRTDEAGNFFFGKIPAGKYEIIAHLNGISDVVKTVEVGGGETSLNFQMILSPVNEQVVVTATGAEEDVYNSYQPVTTLSNLQIQQKNTASLGEVLENESGVAKRSFGPGTSRPVIRGFDGDRVLVMQDGLRLGSVSSQGGAYAEPINVLSVEKIEVVKGAATLLYGSNAIGGVVNAVSDTDKYVQGLSGYLTGVSGTNNNNFGGGGGLKYGVKNFLLWANGGGQRFGDYATPIGEVENSFVRNSVFNGGFGWFPRKGFLSFSYNNDFRRYGLPLEDEDEEETIDLRLRRRSYIFKGGFNDTNSFITSGNFAFQVNDFTQEEIEQEHGESKIGSTFLNKTYVYRSSFDHRRYKNLSGTLGFSGFFRDYKVVGDDRLSPPIKQNNFAAFALERLDFEKIGFQFGGRVEHNKYETIDSTLPNRSFTGASFSFGVRVPLLQNNIIAANYTHSYRAPALEELYNFGPHDDNFAFERGSADLRREAGDGLDVSFRHNSKRFRGELNFFYYNLSDFVFLAFTGETDNLSNLPIADYAQKDSRFVGGEAKLETFLTKYLTLETGVDYVSAKLTNNDVYLPRIPPLRGRIALAAFYKGFSLRPELFAADKQGKVYFNETPTAGYAVVNLMGSYSFAKKNTAHIFSFNAFNLTDKLYRNHLSLIKERAPEIGRGIRFAYTIRFF